MRLAVATLGLALHVPPRAAVAQQCPGVTGRFALTDLTGRCDYAALLDAYARQVHDAAGATTCGLGAFASGSAKADFDAKLVNATGAATGEAGGALVCKALYASQEQVPFNRAADKGDGPDDLHFEQMFFNGLSDWQDEVETLYENYDGTRSSHLREDAAKVREFYDGQGRHARVAWPDTLTNFESSTCTSHAAMCCWPKDRQANDGNGNCATPYDTNCVDKDPADNTNLCFADYQKGDATSGFNSARGFAAFPEDNNDGEGAIHCHGLAWADDEDDAISRYKANNLFFVSMYDHMHQRGYVKNIPGMPMCGCLDQMPLVTRSDCTQVDLTEYWEVEYDPDADPQFSPRMRDVEIDFNACRGRNNRNNDLWAYAARLYDDGRMTRHQFGKVGRVLTNDSSCHHGVKNAFHAKGLVAGHIHDPTEWALVAGRDGMYRGEPLGRSAFNTVLAGSRTADAQPVLLRICPHCRRSHQYVYYRRLTVVPDGVDLLNILLRWHSSSKPTGNRWKEDFTLHSTYEDAVSGANPWKCRNDSFNYRAAFDGECSPDGTRRSNQYSNWWWHPGPQPDVAFYVNAPESAGPKDYIDPNNRNAVETDEDIGYTGQKGNTLEKDGVLHMTGAGQDIWAHADSFHYMSQQWGADIDVKVRMSEFTNNANRHYSKGGLMLRADNDPDAQWVAGFLSYRKGTYFQYRKSKGAHAGSGDNWRTNPVQTDVWLRLVKKMEVVEFWTATDEAGEDWKFRDSTVVLFPNDRYRVGLALTSQSTSYLAEATFEGYEVAQYQFPTSSPSISSQPTSYDPVTEIATQRAGSYEVGADGTETFKGSGSDLWGAHDSFYFHSHQRPLAGDFTVTMYIHYFGNWQPHSRGGLMVRDSLDADAANAFVGAAGARQGAVFQSRKAAGARTDLHNMVWANNDNKFWVRLQRAGDTLTGSYKATAAADWEELGSVDLTFTGTVLYVGRAVTAGRDYSYALETLQTKDYALAEEAGGK